ENPTSNEFVKNALNVYDRMLSVPRVKTLILAAQESQLPNPFKKIGQFNAFLHKAVTAERIEWAVELLLDLYNSGGINIEDMGTRAIEGKSAGSSSGGKGLIDLLVYKQWLLSYMVGEWLDGIALDSNAKAAIRDTCKSIAHFRSKAGYAYNPNMKKPSFAWRAGWSQAAEKTFELIEVAGPALFFKGAIFGYEFDRGIKSAVLKRCDPKSCMEQGDLAEAASTINEMLGTEERTRKAAEDHQKEVSDDPEDEEPCLTLEEMPEIKKLVKKTEADEAKAKRVSYFQAKASTLVHTHVELVSEVEPDDVIIQRFKDSAAYRTTGSKDKRNYRGSFYNPNHCGESSSKPHVRPPSLRGNGEHLRKLLSLALRATDFQMGDRDLYFIFDA
ncbi:unnamed protein product, partial [Prorocentrum cordatum]